MTGAFVISRSPVRSRRVAPLIQIAYRLLNDDSTGLGSNSGSNGVRVSFHLLSISSSGKSRIHTIGDVLSRVREQVPVEIERQADGSVAEHGLDLFWIGAMRNKQARGTVAQVVNSNSPKIGALQGSAPRRDGRQGNDRDDEPRHRSPAIRRDPQAPPGVARGRRLEGAR